MALAKLLGKKVMLVLPRYWSFKSFINTSAVGFVLRFVDTITVRDSISKDELVSLGIEDVEVTADADIGHATSRSFNWLSYSERVYI